MKHRSGRMALVGAIAAALAAPAGAMDLKTAYQAALGYDADFLAARAVNQEAQEGIHAARANLLPQIGYSAQRNSVNTHTHYLKGSSPDTDSGRYPSQSTSLSLRQPLFRKPAWDAYKGSIAQADAAEAGFHKDTQDMGLRVAAAYLEILASRERVVLGKNETIAMEALLSQAEKNFKAGRGTRTDIEDARARYDMAKAKEADANMALATAMRNFEVVTGANAVAIPDYDPRLLDPALMRIENKEAWLQRVEDSAPEVNSLRNQLEAARAGVRQAQSGHLPTVDFVAAQQYSKSDTNYTIGVAYTTSYVGVQVNIPIFGGGGVMAQTWQAQAREERVRQALESSRRKTMAEANRLYLAVEQGYDQVIALKQAVISAEQAVIGDKKGIAAGTRTFVDALDSERRLYEAMRDFSISVYTLANNRLKFFALADAVDSEAIEAVNAWLSTAIRP